MDRCFKEFSLLKFSIFWISISFLSLFLAKSHDITQIPYSIGMVVLIYLSSVLYKNGIVPGDLIGNFPKEWDYWKSIIPLVVLLAIFDIAINQIKTYTLIKDSVVIQYAQSPKFLLVNILILPIQIELLRGILIKKLSLTYNASHTIIFSSVIVSFFSLSPLTGTMIGLVAALLYSKTGTISSLIIFHLLINVIVQTFTNYDFTRNSLITYILLVVFSCTAISYYIYKEWPKSPKSVIG